MKAILDTIVADGDHHVAYVKIVDALGNVIMNKSLPYDNSKPMLFQSSVQKFLDAAKAKQDALDSIKSSIEVLLSEVK